LEYLDGGLEAVLEVVFFVEAMEGRAAGLEVEAFGSGFGGEFNDGVVGVVLDPVEELLAIVVGEGGDFVVGAGAAFGEVGVEEAGEGDGGGGGGNCGMRSADCGLNCGNFGARLGGG
jgi:hypothetical protein